MLGDVWKLKVGCPSNNAGSLGVTFNDYGTGEQVIFANGNYDGFSKAEQKDFLDKVGHYQFGASYHFSNVIKVAEDFNNGVWDEVFLAEEYDHD